MHSLVYVHILAYQLWEWCLETCHLHIAAGYQFYPRCCHQWVKLYKSLHSTSFYNAKNKQIDEYECMERLSQLWKPYIKFQYLSIFNQYFEDSLQKDLKGHPSKSFTPLAWHTLTINVHKFLTVQVSVNRCYVHNLSKLSSWCGYLSIYRKTL